jgi:hypothetical protein
MLTTNVKIIEELKGFVNYVLKNKGVLNQFSRSPADFTRNRKIPFEKLVLLIVRLCKKTLSVEIEKFFEEMGVIMNCSVSAFSQQRVKLGASFFYCWNMVLWLNFYRLYGNGAKRWRGHRVIAADGSSLTLVNTPALKGFFGGQTNQQTFFTVGKTFYCYDVLNELVLFPQLMPYRYGEINMAYDNMNHLQPDMLVIYDRNFCNYKMMALHLWQETEIKFVIRGKEDQKLIRAFIASGKASSVERLLPTDLAIKGLKKSGYMIKKDTALQVRLVRVELGNSVEVLVTNLWEEDGYSADEFKDVYFMRWGIETNISFQKNVLQMESFSGLTVDAVLQDFYATVFMTNLHSILVKDAQKTIDQTIKRKYPAKINKNKSFGKLKNALVGLFVNHDPATILHFLHAVFIRDPLPVRKGRSFDRVRKNPHSKSKYKTFTNFKPAY